MDSPLTWSRVAPVLSNAMAVLGLTMSFVGCDAITGEPAKSTARIETEQKVEALAAQGKSLREIRAIMKGEPLKPSKGSKKATRKH